MGKCMFLRKGETHTAPLSGILASDIAVGSTVKLMENGTAVDYLVVNQGIPGGSSLYDASCDGTWLLRKDIYEKRQWHSSNSNSYRSSTIHSYLNNDFTYMFDANTIEQIKVVKIPHVVDAENSYVASGANGLSAQIFLLSGYEVGGTQDSMDASLPIDGAKLDYFVINDDYTADAYDKRIAYLDGTETDWWLRSMSTGESGVAWRVTIDGDFHPLDCAESLGIRPALILPSTALFDKTTLILKGVA